MIELRQLHYFAAVAEVLSFSRAAERVHIAQPALSMQIKALEQRLGVRLFDRGKRFVSLTSAGALILKEARLTLDQARRTEEVGKRAGRAAVGRVELGYCSSAPFTGSLPAILRQYSASHPGVELVLTECSPLEQSEALERGALDFGVFRLGYAEERPGLVSAPLLRESYDVVMPSAHRLAGRDNIGMAELKTEHFIVCDMPGGAPIPSPLMDLCCRHGFRPLILQNASQLTTIVSLAAAGLGIGIVPHSLSRLCIENAVFRPLAVEEVSVLVFAHRRAERAPATVALIQEARRYAANSAAPADDSKLVMGDAAD